MSNRCVSLVLLWLQSSLLHRPLAEHCSADSKDYPEQEFPEQQQADEFNLFLQTSAHSKRNLTSGAAKEKLSKELVPVPDSGYESPMDRVLEQMEAAKEARKVDPEEKVHPVEDIDDVELSPVNRVLQEMEAGAAAKRAEHKRKAEPVIEQSPVNHVLQDMEAGAAAKKADSHKGAAGPAAELSPVNHVLQEMEAGAATKADSHKGKPGPDAELSPVNRVLQDMEAAAAARKADSHKGKADTKATKDKHLAGEDTSPSHSSAERNVDTMEAVEALRSKVHDYLDEVFEAANKSHDSRKEAISVNDSKHEKNLPRQLQPTKSQASKHGQKDPAGDADQASRDGSRDKKESAASSHEGQRKLGNHRLHNAGHKDHTEHAKHEQQTKAGEESPDSQVSDEMDHADPGSLSHMLEKAAKGKRVLHKEEASASKAEVHNHKHREQLANGSVMNRVLKKASKGTDDSHKQKASEGQSDDTQRLGKTHELQEASVADNSHKTKPSNKQEGEQKWEEKGQALDDFRLAEATEDGLMSQKEVAEVKALMRKKVAEMKEQQHGGQMEDYYPKAYPRSHQQEIEAAKAFDHAGSKEEVADVRHVLERASKAEENPHKARNHEHKEKKEVGKHGLEKAAKAEENPHKPNNHEKTEAAGETSKDERTLEQNAPWDAEDPHQEKKHVGKQIEKSAKPQENPNKARNHEESNAAGETSPAEDRMLEQNASWDEEELHKEKRQAGKHAEQVHQEHNSTAARDIPSIDKMLEQMEQAQDATAVANDMKEEDDFWTHVLETDDLEAEEGKEEEPVPDSVAEQKELASSKKQVHKPVQGARTKLPDASVADWKKAAARTRMRIDADKDKESVFREGKHKQTPDNAWKYLPYATGVPVRCGPPMMITCASDDGVNCKFGEYGQDFGPFDAIPNVNAPQPVKLDCPGWQLKGDTDACEALDCYQDVGFGILLKNWYDVDEKTNTFTADIVLTLKWFNPLATRLIPNMADPGGGLDSGAAAQGQTTMSTAEARQKKLWLPDVAVSNRDVNGTEVLSSSLVIQNSGSCQLVERLLVKVREDFKPEAFPFDVQTLNIKLASTNKMASQLKLEPIPDADVMGADPDKFNRSEYRVIDVSWKSFIETDGSLTKSRGVLTLTLKHQATSWMTSMIMPTLAVTGMGVLAFFFPVAPQFAMPRLSICAFGLLLLVTIRARIEAQVAMYPKVWIDNLYCSCLALIFCFTLFNAWLEYLRHEIKFDIDLPRKMNNEMKILFPALFLTVVVITFASRSGDYASVQGWALTTTLGLGIFGYSVHCLARVYKLKSVQ